MPSPKTKINAGGLKARVTRKVGPLPVYGWVLLIGGAYLAYRHFSGSSTAVGGANASASGSDEVGGTLGAGGDTSGAGGGGSSGAGTESGESGSGYGDLFYALVGALASAPAADTGQTAAVPPPPPPVTSNAEASQPAFTSAAPPPASPQGVAVTKTETSYGQQSPVSKATSGPLKGATAQGAAGGAAGTGERKYYTYAPGKAPAGQKANEVPAGKAFDFKAGQGYFVK